MDEPFCVINRALLTLIVGPLLLLNASTLYADIYRWVDENGKVHFSDKKLDSVEQKVVKPEIIESNWSRFKINVESRGVVLSDKETQEIIEGVNNVYEFYDRVLYFDIYKTVPVKILILKNREIYQNHLRKLYGRKPPPSFGIYNHKDNQIIVYLQKNRDKTFKTIKHEVSHAVIDTITPYAPAWLNEGLAEQMETLEKVNDELRIEPHGGNRRSVERSLKRENLLAVDEFLKLPSHEWRHSLSSSGKPLQSQAGQFVYFLLSTSTDRNFVVRLLHNFERGNRTLSYYLVDDNYIGGIKTLRAKWGRWLWKQSDKAIKL